MSTSPPLVSKLGCLGFVLARSVRSSGSGPSPHTWNKRSVLEDNLLFGSIYLDMVNVKSWPRCQPNGVECLNVTARAPTCQLTIQLKTKIA